MAPVKVVRRGRPPRAASASVLEQVQDERIEAAAEMAAQPISPIEETLEAPQFYEDGQELPKNFKPVPLSGTKLKLALPMRPGFVRRWISDKPGRVEASRRAGYAFIKGKDGKPIEQVVDVKVGGGGIRGYAMEIPKQWYDEAQAETQKEVDRIDAQIKGGKLESNQDDKRYVPNKGAGIDIRQAR